MQERRDASTRVLIVLKTSTAAQHCRIARVMQKLVVAPRALSELGAQPEPGRLSGMNDQITLQLARSDAAALVHVLDGLISDESGTATGSLLRAVQMAIIGAFGGTRPDLPEGWGT